MRFTKDQRDFVTRRELTTIIQPMLDGLKSTIIEEMKEAMNAMESRLRQDSANAIAARYYSTFTQLLPNSYPTFTFILLTFYFSADNIFVRAINARIVSRNERLTPVYSLTTGERIPATGKTISELAQLEGMFCSPFSALKHS